MEFILAEFGIIEEAYKELVTKLISSPRLKFLSAQQFADLLFQIPDGFNNHPFLTSSDLTLGLVRIELVF